MQEQGHGKSVKYSDVQCYGGNFTEFMHESLSYLQKHPDCLIQIYRIDSQIRVYLNDRVPEKENQRVKVKCKQRNAHKSAILPVFTMSRKSIKF